jgi:phosphate transport system substrate-binding protein
MWLIVRLVLIALLAIPVGCDGNDGGTTASESGSSVRLTGAGATFPKPLYEKWAAHYTQMHPNVAINYQGIGSGGGIKQIIEKTVDFGATDGPMTDSQLQKAEGNLLHIPMVLGAVVPVYNLPQVERPLVFSGPVLADLFLGRITRWNDAAIVKLNPDAGLPDRPITIVHRSDGSGTTFIFTDYLSKVSPAWESGPGRGTTVNWPVGRGAKGNDGVAADVKQNEGSLGYVELIYAANNNIAYGSVVNAAGKAVRASADSVSAAASLKDIPEDLRVSITNAPGDSAYPISGLTWILLYQQQADAAKGKALVDFLWWATHEGQAMAAPLH